MRITIRVEMGGIHGMGHAVRMRALACALAEHGAEVHFTTDTPTPLIPFIAPFPVAEAVEECDILVVDTKAEIRTAWYLAHKEAFGCTIVRVDHPDATPETCDLLIGPCAHWDPGYGVRLPKLFGPCVLYGWEYVMLQSSVTSLVPIPYAQRQDGPIVFCAGGSDPAGALQQMATWMDTCRLGTSLVFAMGEYATPLSWGQVPHKTPTSHLMFAPQLLQQAALVVSMFGQVAYEALYYHTPVLMLSHTDENDWGAFYLADASQGAAARLGPLAAQSEATFHTAIRQLWSDPTHRARMAQASEGLLDEHGVKRIAEAIFGLKG